MRVTFFFCFFFLFYLPLYNSTQNTAGAPQKRTPLQIVCAPATVNPVGRTPSNAALKVPISVTAAAGSPPSPSRLHHALRHVHEYAIMPMHPPPRSHATYPPPPPSPRTPSKRQSRTPGKPTILHVECAAGTRRRTAARSPPSPERSTTVRGVPPDTSCVPPRPRPALALPTSA